MVIRTNSRETDQPWGSPSTTQKPSPPAGLPTGEGVNGCTPLSYATSRLTASPWQSCQHESHVRSREQYAHGPARARPKRSDRVETILSVGSTAMVENFFVFGPLLAIEEGLIRRNCDELAQPSAWVE